MKKLISLLAAISVVSACSLSAFAMDFTVGDGTLSAAGNADTKIEKGDNQLYNVNLTELAGGQDQTTILAVKGDAITVGSIQYIGQSATPSFSFDLKDELGSDKVYVLAGGSTLTPTVVGYMQASTAPSTFTVSGTVTGNNGTSFPSVVVSDGTNSYNAIVTAEGTFTVDVPVLATGVYALTASKTGYLKYTKSNIAEAIANINAIIKAGDVNGDDSINLNDLSALLGSYNTSVDTIEKDFDESGTINLNDLSALLVNYNQGSISE